MTETAVWRLRDLPILARLSISSSVGIYFAAVVGLGRGAGTGLVGVDSGRSHR